MGLFVKQKQSKDLVCVIFIWIRHVPYLKLETAIKIYDLLILKKYTSKMIVITILPIQIIMYATG